MPALLPRRALLASALLLALAAMLWFSSRGPGEGRGDDVAPAVQAGAPTPGEREGLAPGPRSAGRSADAGAPAADQGAEAVEPEVHGPPPAVDEDALCAVTVTDDAGLPLAGARIRSTTGAGVEEVQTGGDGRCRVALPTAGERWHLLVEHDGHFHIKAYYMPLSTLELRMSRMRTVHGRVLEARTGVGVAGARVQLPHSSCKHCEADQVVTDAAGSFRIDGVPVARRVVLTADAPGFLEGYRSFELEFEGPEVACDIELERASTQTLRVVDAQSGAPVEGARFMPQGPKSGADGLVEIEVERDSTTPTHVWLQREGYLVTRADRALDPCVTLEVPMLRAASLAVTVVTERGAPVEGATVFGRVAHGRAPEPALPGTSEVPEKVEGWRMYVDEGRRATDARGRATLDGLEPRAVYEVFVLREGASIRGDSFARAPGPAESAEHRVAVPALDDVELCRWRGRVRENGETLPRASIRWTAGERSGRFESDAGGRFEAEIPRVALEVHVRRDRFRPPPLAEPYRFQITPPGDGDLERDLDVLFECATLRVVTRTPSGEPLQGASVIVSFESSPWRTAVDTDEGGVAEVEVPRVSDARLRVLASNAGFHETASDLAPDSVSVEFTLPQAVPARLRLVGEGEVRRDWVLNATMAGFQASGPVAVSGVTDAADLEGWRSIVLPRGVVNLQLEVDRQPFGEPRTIVVAPPEGPDLEFELPR